MKKKNLFLIALLCAYSTLASAYTVTDKGNGVVEIDGGQWIENTVTDDYGDTHTAVSGVEGAGLPGQFTNAEQNLINSATKLIIKGYINSMNAFSAGTQLATSVDMSGAHFKQDLSSVETVTYNKYDPETKETTQVTKTYMKNEMKFKDFKHLTEAVLSPYVESICGTTFQDNNALTTTFIIPESVKYIASTCVANTPIKYIVIPEGVEFIQNGAFQNADIQNLIDVTVNGYTAAEPGAFARDVTVGQTVAGKQIYASLHFPADAVGYFTNQKHVLTQAASLNLGAFQQWLSAHIDNENKTNGWQEFINSSPGDGEPVPDHKIVLRTYSDDVPHYVLPNYRAYVVNGVTGSPTTGFTMELTETFAIPANTGVIIYGEATNGSFSLPILTDNPDTNEDDWQFTPYDRRTETIHGVNMKNYLVPDVEEVELRPYIVNSNNEVTDRNFIMSKYSSTDLSKTYSIANEYIGFFRVKAGKSGTKKAYLSLPATMFTNPEGAEVKVVKTGTFRSDEWNRDYNDYGDWGMRPTDTSILPAALVKSFGEPFSSAIMNVEAENEGGDIYTLQGVKVSAPQKGIYIRNGKKYLVK